MKNTLNRICVCGSGRKRRYCCHKNEARQKSDDLFERQVRKAAKETPRKFLDFMSSNVEWIEIETAWQYFGVPGDELARELFSAVFYPWFIYTAHLTEFDVEFRAKKIDLVAQKFLAKTKNQLSDVEKKFIMSGMHTPLCFFKVLEINTTARTLVMKNMLKDPNGDCSFEIYSRGLSATASVGDICFGIFFETQGVHTAHGVAPIAFDSTFDDNIDRLREYILVEEGLIDDQVLLKYELDLLDEFWDILEAASNPVEEFRGELGNFKRFF